LPEVLVVVVVVEVDNAILVIEPVVDVEDIPKFSCTQKAKPVRREQEPPTTESGFKANGSIASEQFHEEN